MNGLLSLMQFAVQSHKPDGSTVARPISGTIIELWTHRQGRYMAAKDV